jgi:tRNA A37 threonylcarbamoyladenosine synthetase subunit TsaC/SUA5/YrdC
VPSTVVDCTSSDLRLLRPGPLSLEDLKQALA